MSDLINNQTSPETAETAPDSATAPEGASSALIKIEGQEFALDIEIAKDDELLKTALSPHYPSIKNAAITREIRAGQMIVSIVKRAEHKGSGGRKAKDANRRIFQKSL
jgi:hypothetical protein